MELTELRQAALGCTLCGLAERRTNVVFGEGNPTSPLLLIGEGPGEVEDQTGRPFVGRAGQLLDKALADNGLGRTDVYIANVVKCRAADWSTGRPVNRPPSESEVEACRNWLIPQIALIAPKVILCVGSPSAKAIIKRNFKITQERGKYFPCDLAKTVIATLHPSYILRQANIEKSDGGYAFLVADIAKAYEASVRLSSASEPAPRSTGNEVSFKEPSLFETV